MIPTPEQSAIIQHRSGHSLVRAVAGSGKSATLVERIAALLAEGCDPSRLLVLMFNAAARDEFADRLTRRLGGEAAPAVHTFHSFGRRLCAALEDEGYIPSARLLAEPAELARFGRDALQTFNATVSVAERLDLGHEGVMEFIAFADQLKGELWEGGPPPAQVSEFNPLFLRAFKTLMNVQRSAGVRLFGDLIAEPVLASRRSEVIAEFVANRYDHIICDEFQDVNNAQVALMVTLAGSRASVMAVGDEDQTIYAFRGSRPEYIVSGFSALFPGATNYVLTRTFRYGHRLSLFASNVISNNQRRSDKLCLSGANKETSIAIRMAGRGQMGHLAAQEINAWQSAGRSCSEVAVIVRQFAHAMPVEMALLDAGIPFRIEGAQSFPFVPEILMLRGYMHLACDSLSAIGDADTREQAMRAMICIPSLFLHSRDITSIARRFSSLSEPTAEHLARAVLNATADPHLRPLRQAAARLFLWAQGKGDTMDAGEFLKEVVRRSRLFDHFIRNSPQVDGADRKMRLVKQFIWLAEGYTVRQFAHRIRDAANATPPAAGSVLLTSVHRSKGLEWPLVIIPELIDGQFPAKGAELEDERRLFYVGATRAQERLVMLAPLDNVLHAWATAMQTGHPSVDQIQASRFLYEGNAQACLRAGRMLENGERPNPSDFGAGGPLIQRYLRELEA